MEFNASILAIKTSLRLKAQAALAIMLVPTSVNLVKNAAASLMIIIYMAQIEALGT
jgi:hypothetical protein